MEEFSSEKFDNKKKSQKSRRKKIKFKVLRSQNDWKWILFVIIMQVIVNNANKIIGDDCKGNLELGLIVTTRLHLLLSGAMMFKLIYI